MTKGPFISSRVSSSNPIVQWTPSLELVTNASLNTFKVGFVIVQKRLNVGGLRTLSRGLLARLVSGTWILGGFPPFK